MTQHSVAIRMLLFQRKSAVHLDSTKYNQALQALLIATFAVIALFFWQGNKGFNLWDEGFLWYGAQRVLEGEVPLLDFMSYDPGRYYWSAAFMKLSNNNGIMSLRSAVAGFQVLGLFTGLFLITRYLKKQSLIFTLFSAVSLIVWMFPRHKLFDISLSIFLIAALTLLAHSQTKKNYFFAGIVIGLVAVFGRNHGVYGAVACLGLMLWLDFRQTSFYDFTRKLSLWSLGILIGFSPIVLMMLFIPGFANAFLESIRYLFEAKATNIALPVPWPWLVTFDQDQLSLSIRQYLIGLFFIAVISFGVISLISINWQKLRGKTISPIIVATAFLALPYAHYAFSRADLAHLAQGIFPMLIGSLAYLARTNYIKWPLSIALCFASLWVMHLAHPGWQCDVIDRCKSIEISGDEIQSDSRTIKEVELLRDLEKKYAQDRRSFMAAPFWPGAYALLERRAPIRDIYPLLPRSESFQAEEIRRLESTVPAFIILVDLPLDGQEKLHFSKTNTQIFEYIKQNFSIEPQATTSVYKVYLPEVNQE